jgi:hypothetical protein
MPQAELPAWNEHGLLPPGIHACTMAEIEARLGAFQRSDRRMRLFRKLAEYVGELRKTGWNVQLLIDGSFVMQRVNEPNDIDIILVFPADWNPFADVLPVEYNLLSGRRVKRNYGFDVFSVRAGSPQESELLTLFAQVSPRWCDEFGFPRGLSKGLVRLVP